MVIGNGRIVAQGTKAELLAAAGTVVRAAGSSTSSAPCRRRDRLHGHPATAALRTDAEPALVGKVALEAGLALTELRSADGAGLEEMFLELTADTQREGAAA